MNDFANDHREDASDRAVRTGEYDYDFVDAVARIAVYDNLRSAPRMIEIKPAPTNEYITDIASQTYTLARQLGGSIPFSVIQEVSENFIHARFTEAVVSILDNGNTIRFADQGPGIASIEKAQLPGFSSAKEPMKKYIRGVGSGLPIVKEYFEGEHGTVLIEDNIGAGAVVTISLAKEGESQESPLRAAVQRDSKASGITAVDGQHILDNAVEEPSVSMPVLNEKEELFLQQFLVEGPLGVTEMSAYTDTPNSSTHKTMAKLTELKLIEQPKGTKKRTLTEYGRGIAKRLQEKE